MNTSMRFFGGFAAFFACVACGSDPADGGSNAQNSQVEDAVDSAGPQFGDAARTPSDTAMVDGTSGVDGSSEPDVTDAATQDALAAKDTVAITSDAGVNSCANNADCSDKACNLQTSQCVDPCVDPTGVIETCDGADNDCNKLIDDATCADGDPCTEDQCFAASGKCKSIPGNNGVACDDGQICTVDDSCGGGNCSGTPKLCDDDNPCTLDGCSKKTGACGSVPGNNGKACDDGDACSLQDTCSGGSCGGDAKPCADDDPCTEDGCAKGACTFVPQSAAATIACDDGQSCTVDDVCDLKGGCSGAAKLCDDQNPCTADSCQPTTGACDASPVAAADLIDCDDGSVCTQSDFCQGDGTCKGLKAKPCDDGNPCTTDTCAPGVGCQSAPLQGNATCGPGLVCSATKCVQALKIGLCGTDGSKPCAKLALGGQHSCAIWGDGRVRCWGAGTSGQLGGGWTVDSPKPVTPAGDFGDEGGVLALAAGRDSSCALTKAGAVACWGGNDRGQLSNAKSAGSYGLDPAREPHPTAVKGLSNVVDLVAADRTYCALHADGTVWCWGDGARGNLGDGKSGEAHLVTAPQKVSGLSKVVALAAGGEHVCARTAGKKALCWGGNSFGEIGNSKHAGTIAGGVPKAFSKAPEQAGITDVEGLWAGAVNTCARRPDGSHACWGRNDTGQVGNYKTAISYGSAAPVEAAPAIGSALAKIRQFSAHVRHACVVRADWTVACWGSQEYGGVGNGKLAKGAVVAVPQPVVLPNAASEIASGGRFPQLSGESEGHSCARLADQSVRCWGSNARGQLGDGTTITRALPVAVAAELCAGATKTECDDGDVCTTDVCDGGFCAHNAGPTGACDDGSQCTTADVCVAGKCQGKAKSCDDGNACTVDACAPKTGQCGGTPVQDGGTCTAGGAAMVCHKGTCSSPLAVGFCGLDGAKPCRRLGAGALFTCAMFGDGGGGGGKAGTVQCWGSNAAGQFGNGVLSNQSAPTKGFSAISDGLALVAGSAHACALRTTGQITCAGSNRYGQLGNGKSQQDYVKDKDYELTPVTTQIGKVVDFASGGFHVCALTDDGAVRCWGNNQWGQGGDGTTAHITKPKVVAGLGKAAAIATGYGHTCARLVSGQVACWGFNGYGQVGNGKVGADYGKGIPGELGPTLVGALTDAVQLWAGGFTTCARRKNGTVFCWGLNNYGQLGNGTTVGDKVSYQSKPKESPALSGATLIQSQLWHVCGLLKDGKLGCWGTSFHGALGNGESGALKSHAVPVFPKVPGTIRDLSGGALSLSNGSSTSHSCALNDNGEVWCWGQNGYGQLGTKPGNSAVAIKTL